jgi:tRNA-2-methylthio-N6-dimethylallyladenosine synthase
MNEYDTELVRSILARAGYEFVRDELSADVVMLNTCAIRENAHRKVYGRVHEIKHLRNGSASAVKIGILGCMATNLRTDLLENKHLDIDFIAGPDSYKRLPDLIAEAFRTGEKQFDLTLSEFETYSDVYPTRQEGINAWIAVMRGCNNFCTFCVVPYTRGRERSRAVDQVTAEVERLMAEGFKQVTLLGQNVNSYAHNGADFADLLEAVSRVEGIQRIRFTSPHPKDFPDKLLNVVAHNLKVCKHIHLPLQAGNDRVLDLMSRTYTCEEFLGIAAKIRRVSPGIVLTTDIIVGFPTETDAEFADTVRILEEVQFDSAFIFKYSERKNTIASRKLPDDIPEAIKTERIVHLNEIQRTISLKKNQAHIGEVHSVMIERQGTSRSADDLQGRTDGNKLVIFPPGPSEDFRIGQLIPVTITDATPHVLKGNI